MTLVNLLLGLLVVICIVWAVTVQRAKNPTRKKPTFSELFARIQSGSETASIYASVRREYGEHYANWLFELYVDCLTGKKTVPLGKVDGCII